MVPLIVFFQRCLICEHISSCARPSVVNVKREALAAYDNGEKIVVCDLTCQDDVANPSDVSHCNCEWPFAVSAKGCQPLVLYSQWCTEITLLGPVLVYFLCALET